MGDTITVVLIISLMIIFARVLDSLLYYTYKKINTKYIQFREYWKRKNFDL